MTGQIISKVKVTGLLLALVVGLPGCRKAHHIDDITYLDGNSLDDWNGEPLGAILDGEQASGPMQSDSAPDSDSMAESAGCFEPRPTTKSALGE